MGSWKTSRASGASAVAAPGPSHLSQCHSSWGAAEDKIAVDKILPLFKKRFHYFFKSLEATTLMTCSPG